MSAAAAEPRESYDLSGHETEERAFLDALRRGRLHHAWLLTGPRGVGKATFAYRAARRLLGARDDPGHGILGAAPDDPVCHRIEAGAHGDLLVLSKPWDDKRGRYRGAITVDEARKLGERFASTAGEGGWRVAIIDAADDLNVNAANAILKTLEEPPSRAVIFLVCHAPGRLPTTVRSRCRRLRFAAPDENTAASIVARALGCDDAAARAAARLASGRPGEAIRLAAAGGADLAPQLADVLDGLPRLDGDAAHRLADALGGVDDGDLRAFFFDALAAHALGEARGGRGVDAWGGFWERSQQLARELDGLNLDPKLAVLDALAAARTAAETAAEAA